MARKITNNLNRNEVVQVLEDVSNKLVYVSKTIQLNLGKDPIIWRRSQSLISKVEELIEFVERN